VTKSELEKQLRQARENGLTVKAMAIINPGNPTGQVMDRDVLEIICRFCSDNQIVLLADEVYQRNVYAPNKTFISARKIAFETPGCENLQLVSFHSTSKGLIGECGRRGGYMELHNIESRVQENVHKLAATGLCSGLAGQVMTSLMVNPPRVGDASYESFVSEEKAIYDGLVRRSRALVQGPSTRPQRDPRRHLRTGRRSNVRLPQHRHSAIGMHRGRQAQSDSRPHVCHQFIGRDGDVRGPGERIRPEDWKGGVSHDVLVAS